MAAFSRLMSSSIASTHHCRAPHGQQALVYAVSLHPLYLFISVYIAVISVYICLYCGYIGLYRAWLPQNASRPTGAAASVKEYSAEWPKSRVTEGDICCPGRLPEEEGGGSTCAVGTEAVETGEFAVEMSELVVEMGEFAVETGELAVETGLRVLGLPTLSL
eukprot:1349454-Pyramimonas_sp.AAC.1